eukprot:4026860-Amphidinium_carterae.1
MICLRAHRQPSHSSCTRCKPTSCDQGQVQGLPCLGVRFEHQHDRPLRARIVPQAADGNSFWRSVAPKASCWKKEKNFVLRVFDDMLTTSLSLQRNSALPSLRDAR